uniref:Disease resistance R13L4/SHOC-2-like LRR domain-containing protein n=1 Tax=Lygus hesperus TaxID=30085 RepID=A0A0K8SJA3_LYGHE
MAIRPENRKVWKFLMENMFKKELVEELKGRHVLHWNYRGYEHLPQELLVFGMHVEELYLKGNRLCTLPPWLNTLSNITNLYLEGNALQELPPTIGCCQMLDVLDLEDNQLTQLPDELCSLRNLTCLNLRGNCIRKLPKDLGNLKALAVLNLTNNGMTQLPECICDLRSLQELILDDNLLRSLPSKIVLLPNLPYLSVSKNYLEYLPLMFFVNHASITFTHNPGLNYIQYELGCDLSINSFVVVDIDDDDIAWRLDMTGCSENKVVELEGNRVYIQIASDKSVLKLPSTFKKLHQPCKTNIGVPSLFELAARESYEVIAGTKSQTNDELDELIECTCNIPPIRRVLEGGPTARCSNVECCQALFTEAVVWAMWMPVSSGEGLLRTVSTLLFFCSTLCSRVYSEQHQKEALLRTEWTQLQS